MHPNLFTFSLCLLLLVKLVPFAKAASQIRIFIDSVPEYDLLSSCAEHEVSTIVRDMVNGCGDGSHTSSYLCFCYRSSVKYSSMIGSKVSTACTTDPAQNSSAVEVFSKYCQLGQVEIGQTTTAAPTASSTLITTTSSASPASGPATVFVTPTSTPTPESSASSTRKDTPVVAIAVGVTVPIVVIALAIFGFIFYRARRKEPPAELASDHAVEEVYSGGTEIHELKQSPTPPPIEIGDTREIKQISELDTPKEKVWFERGQELDA